MSLVAELVDCLHRHDGVDHRQGVRPIRRPEICFDEHDPLGQTAETFFRDVVHGRREVQRRVGRTGESREQVFGEETRTGAKFENRGLPGRQLR